MTGVKYEKYGKIILKISITNKADAYTVEEEDGELILKGKFPSSWDANFGNNSLVFTHEARDKTSITLYNCKNIYIENGIIVHGAGLSLIAMSCENVYLDNFSMYKNYGNNGRLVANNADAVHFFNCKGDFVLKNSYMEALLDDTVNIHNNYYSVKKSEGNVLTLEIRCHGLNLACPLFSKGDDIIIFKGSTLEEKGRFNIKNIETDKENKLFFFTLDRDVSIASEGDTVENLSAQAKILIENCKFGIFRGTMRLQSRNETILRNCEFNNKEVSVLFTGDTNYWYESGPVRDVLIENCKFEHADKGYRFVFITSVDFTDKENYYHQNIKVKNCTFEGGKIASLSHVKGFTFSGNNSADEMVIEAKDSINIKAENAKLI